MVAKGTINIHLRKLISELKSTQVDLWKKVAFELEKSRRNRRVVNISSINRHCKAGEIALVPGKVLGDGALTKKLNVAAFNISESAKEKVKEKGGKVFTIAELLKANPEGKGVRIIG